ncbi:MAG: hypothetical protein IJW99_05655 [Clostridia bacterium]|nr:hypothetical protein [Clostridia bacterium]
MARIYHVAKNGNDRNIGTAEMPFLTISRAAKLADEGDTVIVHAGVYREHVSPEHGARSELGRITYMAAEGEKVIIKGSEELTDWKKDGALWKVTVDNRLFGDHNPYETAVDGDWLVKPLDPPHHTGMIYLDGTSLDEVVTMEELLEKPMTWLCAVSDTETTIYANFKNADPNAALTEMNVRRSCFYPERSGLNYITVRGFEMAHAATNWAPPTSDQVGLLGPHFAKGWIIEDNIIHDARCAAVSLGKDGVTGDNIYTHYHRKAGYYYQYEAMLSARRMGWSRETIGSHIVRNNLIYNCGQNGIVGHMGCAFSEIYGNEIYNVGNKKEFTGYEVGAIKLHAPIDTQIHHNLIHDSFMGTWLDWQAQGCRLSANVYYNNGIDIKIEVTHGPHLVDNNICASEQNFQNAAQGGAYVHNLFLGGMFQYPVLDRSTPYHLPHSTDMMGCTLVYSNDDRFYNNIFGNVQKTENKKFIVGLGHYNGAPDTLEEYLDTVFTKYGKCDTEAFSWEKQPLFTKHNYYGDGVPAYDRDHTSVKTETATDARVYEENGNVYLEMTLDESFSALKPEIVDTKRLELPRISEAPYENPDGSPITVDTDLLGNRRGAHPTTGPIENIGTGRVKVLIAKRK